MNDARRKEINRAKELLDQARAIIETAESDERDYYDNLPENFQSGEKGERAEASADALQEAIDGFDTIVEALDRATE